MTCRNKSGGSLFKDHVGLLVKVPEHVIQLHQNPTLHAKVHVGLLEKKARLTVDLRIQEERCWFHRGRRAGSPL